MPRPLRKLTGVLQTVLTLMAVGAAGLLFVPRLLGWQVDTVLSGSMAPKYPVESVLFVKPVNPSAISVGDVITFRTGATVASGSSGSSGSSGAAVGGGATPVSHRVVSIDRRNGERSFVTKGDANRTADPDPVPASAVEGRVVFGVPALGRLVRAVRTPVGFALLLLLPGLALVAAPRRDLLRSRRPASLIMEGSAS